MNHQDALEQLAARIKALSFVEHYHQDVGVIVRSGKNLIASWWWPREGYKSRRWELSIRFPGDLIKRYCELSEDERSRAAENVRITVAHFVGNLDIIPNNDLPDHPQEICELDERMFD